MTTRWKVRDHHFMGPGKFSVPSDDGKTISVEVDRDGYFICAERSLALGIYAKPIERAK